MFYTINETRDALKKGETSSVELVKNAVETFNKDKSAAIPLNAFIEMYDDAVAKAEAADKEISEAKANGSLDALYEKKPLLTCILSMSGKRCLARSDTLFDSSPR